VLDEATSRVANEAEALLFERGDPNEINDDPFEEEFWEEADLDVVSDFVACDRVAHTISHVPGRRAELLLSDHERFVLSADRL
jgi:hypothetical protein